MTREGIWLVWISIWVLSSLIVAYVIGAVSLLLSSSVERTEDGELIINMDSWHFKFLSYIHDWENRTRLDNSQLPSTSERRSILNIIKDNGIGICAYYAMLFFTMVLEVPISLMIELIKTIIYFPFTILFGYSPKPSFENAFDFFHHDDVAYIQMRSVPFPEFRGVPLVPAWIVIPGLIMWGLFLLWTKTTWFPITVMGLAVAFVVVAFIVFIVKVIKSRKRSFYQRENLFIASVKAKWAGFCPIAKVR